MVRYEFGSSSCSRLALCLSWMLAETIRPSFAQAASAAGGWWTRPASDRSRDVGARWRFLEGGVRSHALFQVDNVPMANLLRGDRYSGGAAVLPWRYDV